MQSRCKFSIAIHILLFLVIFSGKNKITSQKIADSTGCNAVIVRKIIGNLKKAGMVSVLRARGGTTLCKKPEDITLWEVYASMQAKTVTSLFKLHTSPSQQCTLGQSIYTILAAPYQQAETALEHTLQKTTLQHLVGQYQALSTPCSKSKSIDVYVRVCSASATQLIAE